MHLLFIEAMLCFTGSPSAPCLVLQSTTEVGHTAEAPQDPGSLVALLVKSSWPEGFCADSHGGLCRRRSELVGQSPYLIEALPPTHPPLGPCRGTVHPVSPHRSLHVNKGGQVDCRSPGVEVVQRAADGGWSGGDRHAGPTCSCGRDGRRRTILPS